MTKNELFEKNRNLVYHCFHRYVHCPPEMAEDVIQEGMLGLWKVCLRFDESQGTAFSTFAVPNITGYMKQYVRNHLFAIRPSRKDWESGKPLEFAIASLDNSLDPEDSTSDTMYEIVADKPDFYEELFLDDIESFLATIKNARLHDIAEEFLYSAVYGETPSQDELSQKYGYSQPQVSRCLNRIRHRFKEYLKSIEEVE